MGDFVINGVSVHAEEVARANCPGCTGYVGLLKIFGQLSGVHWPHADDANNGGVPCEWFMRASLNDLQRATEGN